jgi:hypothetical protein
MKIINMIPILRFIAFDILRENIKVLKILKKPPTISIFGICQSVNHRPKLTGIQDWKTKDPTMLPIEDFSLPFLAQIKAFESSGSSVARGENTKALL